MATYSESPSAPYTELGSAVAIDGPRTHGGAPDVNGLVDCFGATSPIGPGGSAVTFAP